MIDKSQANQKATQFFDDLWRQGDPWRLETSSFERARYAALDETLGERRFGRVLEIGCGAGAFTHLLARRAEAVVAMDVSPEAIARASSRGEANVEFRVANVMGFDHRQHPQYDLVVLSETVYYLGWLYSFFDVSWIASELAAATSSGGWLLLANTLSCPGDALISPGLIRTYHDLFRNVGYGVRSESVFTGEKDGVAIEVLITLGEKP